MAAFVGPCPEGKEILHWDDDKQNCALLNMRYGTRFENAQDRKRNGRYDNVVAANKRRAA